MARWFWYFLLYSFLGFFLEVAYTRLTGGRKPDRKCYLFLPLCPVYGLGALGVLALPGWITGRWWLLWLAGGAVCTAVEYLLALFYEGTLGVRFWSYEGRPGNLQGRVCPGFALAWGGLAVVVYYALHPLVARLAAGIPQWLTLLALFLLTLDSWATLALLSREGDPACLKWYARMA